MKALRLTVGIVSLFFMFSTFGFAQDPFSMKEDYKIMPLSPSSGIFTTPQEAVQNLPLEVGEAKLEFSRKDVTLLSQGENKVTLEYIGTQEKIQLAYNENSIVIEYGGTTLTLDSNVDIGKIEIDENGQLKVYDKNNNVIAFLNKEGWGYAYIDGLDGAYVTFDKGTKVNLKGDGKVTSIEVETNAGSYIVEKTNDGKIKVTSAGGDTFTYNPEDFGWNSVYIKDDGTATLTLVPTAGDIPGTIRINYDSKGKASSIRVYDSEGNPHAISLEREEGLELNMNVNEDLSVTIKSNADNSVALKFKQDGSVEAIKPDGTLVPISGDIEKATFNDNGSLKLNLKGGAVITINPDEMPNPGWWDGMTTEEICSTLQDLVKQGKLDEATQKYAELAGADLDLAVQAMEGMKVNVAAQLINKMDLNLAVGVLNKLDSQKVVEILTAIEPGSPNYDARLDLNGDGVINLGGDVALFIGKIGAKEGDPNYDARLDLDGDGVITVTGDVFMFRGHIGASRGSTTPIIAADKAGQILAAMDKQKAADVLEAVKAQDAVPIVKAMLKNQGVEKVADIMKAMDPAKVAAIMAVPTYRLSPDKPEIMGPGLTVKECADILKTMGGLKTKEVRAIMSNLFKLNTWKAIQIYWRLGGHWFPVNPRPILSQWPWLRDPLGPQQGK